MSSKKSIKTVYDENRLLYAAKKQPLQIREFDPREIEVFFERFYAKRKMQMKMRKFLFAASCIITFLIVVSIVNALNSIT